MRIADVCLPEPPPTVRTEAQKGETHYQAAKRMASGLRGPHVVTVRYLNPKGRGGWRGFSIQETSYFVDGGEVVCQATIQGRCQACGGWSPRLVWNPWGEVGYSGRLDWYCLPCLRKHLGISPDVSWPPRIVVPREGPPACTCGGPLAYAWVWLRDYGSRVLQGAEVLKCARCAATYRLPRWSARRTPAQIRRERALAYLASGELRPVCWHRQEVRCALLYERVKPGVTCPWSADCETYPARLAEARR